MPKFNSYMHTLQNPVLVNKLSTLVCVYSKLVPVATDTNTLVRFKRTTTANINEHNAIKTKQCIINLYVYCICLYLLSVADKQIYKNAISHTTKSCINEEEWRFRTDFFAIDETYNIIVLDCQAVLCHFVKLIYVYVSEYSAGVCSPVPEVIRKFLIINISLNLCSMYKFI